MAHKPKPGWQIYKEQMYSLCHGYALWEPAPTQNYKRINFGDVGFIRGGQFHLLFSAGRPLGERRPGIDVPLTFEELKVGTPVFRQPRRPGCLRTDTVREIGAGLGASVATTPGLLESGAHFTYELTGECGAALVTRHKTYTGDAMERDAFEEYTEKHYDSWVTFARDKRYGSDVKPFLVSGFDMTKDFAMAAYSHDGASLESDLTISVPALASASASLWGTWRTRGLTHTNYGPQECIPPSFAQIAHPSSEPTTTGTVSDDHNQCVFVRYFTMRKRMGFYPMVIRASAGPHDLGSGNNHDDTFPELMTRQDPTPDHEDNLMGSDEVRYLTVGGVRSDQDIVVYNTPDDEGYDEFDTVADYVFQNSKATSALMHHQDLTEIRAVEGVGDISFVLAKSRPHIVVSESGVGRIVWREDPSQHLETPVATLPLQLSAHLPQFWATRTLQHHWENSPSQETNAALVATPGAHDHLGSPMCSRGPQIGSESYVARLERDVSPLNPMTNLRRRAEDRRREIAQMKRVRGLLRLTGVSKASVLEEVIRFLGGTVPGRENETFTFLRRHSEGTISQLRIGQLFKATAECIGHPTRPRLERGVLLEEVVKEIERRMAGI